MVGRLEEMLKATARAADLTRQLLAFSRKQVLQPRVVNLSAVTADLPRVDEAAQPPASRSEGTSTVRGSESILVVEDDEALRAIIAEVLEDAGYSVRVARNGDEAIRAAGERRPIDLVVSDMVMPAMGGGVLAKRLPHLRFLFMSGYTELSVAEDGGLTRGAAFLQKPFTPGALLRKVRGVLDGRPE